MEIAILGLGCFWGPEIKFSKIDGVIRTEGGYCGGNSSSTTYKEVCTGKTNHAEVVKLEFDEKVISFKKILDLFFKMHDPTQKDMQYPDVGTQYRSEIFYETEKQNQEASEVLQDGESVEKTLSIIELITSGGTAGMVIIAVLILMLIFTLYIYFERILTIKEASKIDANFMNQIKDYVSNGKIDSAQNLCSTVNSPVSRLISKGVSRIGKPLEDINTAIENAGRLEIYNLEKNVSVLATISGAAPMIGFLGTVIGMILSIFEIANSGGSIDIKTLADGLYTAMTTTVAGLIVGIVAYIAYNHLVVKTDKVVYQMEANSLEFLDLLNEPS